MGPADLRGHKEPVHGLDRGVELRLDRFSGAAPRLAISRQSPFQASPGGAFEKNPQCEEPAKGWPAQQPKTLDDDEGFWPENLRGRQAGVRFEIIGGHARRVAGMKPFQCVLEGVPVNGARVIEIEPGAPGRSQVGAVAVKVVEANAQDVGRQGGFELRGQPGFARTAAAGNGEEQGPPRLSRLESSGPGLGLVNRAHAARIRR